jgi:hypothetical protein
MKRATGVEQKKESRRNDFPELQVGFPERNDVANPIDEMERIHVDLETLNISRKNSQELTREIVSQDSSNDKK